MLENDLMKLDLYGFMGIPTNSQIEEITAAFKRMALKFHPDKNSDQNATSQFQKLGAVFKILKDEKKKAEYDCMLIERQLKRSRELHADIEQFYADVKAEKYKLKLLLNLCRTDRVHRHKVIFCNTNVIAQLLRSTFILERMIYGDDDNKGSHNYSSTEKKQEEKEENKKQKNWEKEKGSHNYSWTHNKQEEKEESKEKKIGEKQKGSQNYSSTGEREAQKEETKKQKNGDKQKKCDTDESEPRTTSFLWDSSPPLKNERSITLIINYQLPDDPELYGDRVNRSAGYRTNPDGCPSSVRNEKVQVINLVATAADLIKLKNIEKYYRTNIVEVPVNLG